MPAYLVVRNRTRELVSSGTVLADKLPRGLSAVEVDDDTFAAFSAGELVWDRKTRRLVDAPERAAAPSDVDTALRQLDDALALVAERVAAVRAIVDKEQQ